MRQLINFRWIETKEELERLAPIMERFGWTALNPYFSKALVAEDENGEIVGFNVLQMAARPEPLWISPLHRGQRSGLAAELASQMSEHLIERKCPYWAIKTDSWAVEKICKANGMKKSEYPFYEGGA